MCDIVQGDALERLRELPDRSVQMCCTSPPYYRQRDYGIDGQLGLEPTPDEYVARLAEVFAETRRVLCDDGVLWLNLGDTYHEGGRLNGLKAKDLIGIPWMVAFALRADGWWLRSENIWAKPNPRPENVGDRCTRSHEQLFMLTKASAYRYDADAIREKGVNVRLPGKGIQRTDHYGVGNAGNGGLGALAARLHEAGTGQMDRNKRSVWEVPVVAYPGAHFATFPPELIEPCVLACSRRGDTVLDPFAGSGTVGVVCAWYGREFVGIELNPDYCEMARRRIRLDGARGKSVREQAVPDGQLALLPHDAT